MSTFSSVSSASAFRISTPASAPRPVPTMIDIGVARPSAQGHAMIRTATALTSACARRGSGPNKAQTTKVTTATSDHGRNEPRRDHVGQPLDRRPRALRFAHHADDLREHVSAADALRPHHEAAGAVDRAAGDLAAGRLFHGHRLAGDHRFVHGARALEHDAVDRRPSRRAGPGAGRPPARWSSGTSCFAAVLPNQRAVFGASPAGSDRAAGLAARAKLQHLSEQNERDDDRRRLEVDGERRRHASETTRERPGASSADHAVQVGRAGAERNQREHVEMPVHDRGPAALEERQARPREPPAWRAQAAPIARSACTEQMLQRLARDHARMTMSARIGAVSATLIQKRRVMSVEFGIRCFRAGIARLQRHAADRTRARLTADDLRVHRTRVFDLLVLGGGRGFIWPGSQILLRIRLEPLHTGRITEIVGLSLVVGMSGRGGGVDEHPANRVLHTAINR